MSVLSRDQPRAAVRVAAAAVAANLSDGAARAQAGAGGMAVLPACQRFGQGTSRNDRGRAAQFEAHVWQLTNRRYEIMPLPAIPDVPETGASLPNRTVGITMDGAFRSVCEEAWPRLNAAG